MAAAAKKKDGIWETVKTVIYALLIAGVFRTLFFQKICAIRNVNG